MTPQQEQPPRTIDFSRAPEAVRRCTTHHACLCHQWMADMWRSQDATPSPDALREALERLAMAADAVDSGEPLQAEPYLTAYREAWTELEEAIEQAQVALSATTPSPSSGLDVDDGRISRQGWHYPRCWELWVGAWYRDEFECICARLQEQER